MHFQNILDTFEQLGRYLSRVFFFCFSFLMIEVKLQLQYVNSDFPLLTESGSGF